MSVLRRLFQKFRSPNRFVGKDLEGNRFYEYPSVTEDPRRTKRVVKYSEGRDMWHYVAGSRRLPVQWTSWLTHTRPDAPTLEELQDDVERQRRVAFNAAMIEARDREDRARQITAAQKPPQRTADRPLVASIETSEKQSDSVFDFADAGASESQKPQPRRTSDFVRSDRHGPSAQSSDEPQPWSPKTMRRTGS